MVIQIWKLSLEQFVSQVGLQLLICMEALYREPLQVVCTIHPYVLLLQIDFKHRVLGWFEYFRIFAYTLAYFKYTLKYIL